MKKTIKVISVLVVCLAALWLSRKSIYEFVVIDHPDEPFTEFSLQDLEGNTIDSSFYKDKVVVLDFWATWCGVCIKAFPAFQKVVQRYDGDPRVNFIAINIARGNDSLEVVRRFVSAKNCTFPVAYDQGSKLSDKLGIRYLPTLFIIDAQGRLQVKHIGYQELFEDYETALISEIERLF